MHNRCGLAVDYYGKVFAQDLCLYPQTTGLMLKESFRVIFVHKFNTVYSYFTQAKPQAFLLFNTMFLYLYSQTTGHNTNNKLIKEY
jgi:hypothetical protein